MIPAINLLKLRSDVKQSDTKKFNLLPRLYQVYLNHFEQDINGLPYSSPVIAYRGTTVVLGMAMKVGSNIFKEEGDYLHYMMDAQQWEDQEESYRENLEFGLDFSYIGASHSRNVLIGINRERNFGKIYLLEKSSTEVELVADNIFDFFRRIMLVHNYESFVHYEIDPNSLYKNWNEDFWRIKEVTNE